MNYTIEDKIQFVISQAWGQYIDLSKDNHTTCILVNEKYIGEVIKLLKKGYALVRTSLSQISGEDAIELAKFLGFTWDDPIVARGFILQLFLINSNDPIKEELIMRQMLFKFSDISSAVDRIRKMGYAYEFDGKSVEEQIKLGWTKLRE